jgi:hypothetical protein
MNNLSKQIMGLYLYAMGSQRQSISVMSHLGISESYPGLTGKPRTIRQKFPKHVRSTTPHGPFPTTPSTTPHVISQPDSILPPEIDPERLAGEI